MNLSLYKRLGPCKCIVYTRLRVIYANERIIAVIVRDLELDDER